MDTPEKRKRFYDSGAWKALRLVQLRKQPLCEVCFDDGHVVPAVAVDHRESIAQNAERRLDPENLQSLCLTHHSQKTGAEQRGNPDEVRGCDERGWPRDPTHHWNRKP